VAYSNPKLAVAVIVQSKGELLMQRRAIEPGAGRWTFPSGYVDGGEVVEEAAVREVLEETGLHVTLDGLVGLYSQPHNPVVLAVYHGRVNGGQLAPGDEVYEVAFFPLDSLPPLAFPHDGRILEDWKRLRKKGNALPTGRDLAGVYTDGVQETPSELPGGRPEGGCYPPSDT